MDRAAERKAKRTQRRAQIVKHYEGSIAGAEPSFAGIDQRKWDPSERKTALLNALNYYNAKWNPDARRKALVKHLTANKAAKHPSVVPSSLKDNEIPQTLVAMGVIQDNGFLFTKKEQEYYDRGMQALAEICHANTVSKSTSTTPTVTIQDRIEQHVRQYLGALEGKIDDFILGGCKGTVSITTWLQEQNIKGMYAKRIADWFRVPAEETWAAYKKVDDQLAEGYAGFGPVKLKALQAAYAQIVADAEQWAGAKTAVRQVTKRAKSPEKQIKRLQYLSAFPALKLESIKPEKVLGAGNVWIYNTKTRQLGWYHAADAAGLAVKGTTFINFDQKASGLKKLRKPEVTIPLVLGGQRPAEKAFAAVKAVQQTARGRMNKFTVILRAHAIL